MCTAVHGLCAQWQRTREQSPSALDGAVLRGHGRQSDLVEQGGAPAAKFRIGGVALDEARQ